MAHCNVVVPVQTGESTRYRRVGAMFENVRRGSGETWYKLVLDFPVGALELLAFPPRASEDGAGAGDATAAAGAAGTARARFNVVVPVQAGHRTHYTRVGGLFENVGRETGETWYRLVLDFPVGALELLAFPPRPGEGADHGEPPA